MEPLEYKWIYCTHLILVWLKEKDEISEHFAET